MSDDMENRGLNRRWLQRRFEMLSTVKAEFNYEFRLDGSVSDATHAEFETEILNMYDALEHKKEHQVAKQTWEQFQMELIPQYCSQTRVVRNESVGHSGIKQTSEEVVLDRAPPQYLKEWFLGFVRILDDLGLNTSVKQGVESNDISHEDLDALLQLRNQQEAQEHANVD